VGGGERRGARKSESGNGQDKAEPPAKGKGRPFTTGHEKEEGARSRKNRRGIEPTLQMRLQKTVYHPLREKRDVK